MNLNESQGKFIINKVSAVWNGKRDCPICVSQTSWGVGSIVEVREFNEGNDCPGAAITPLIQVQCNNCGYTILFNAIGLGVVDKETGELKEGK